MNINHSHPIAMPAGDAVLDNTTGLVWERSPIVGGGSAWNFIKACFVRNSGGVQGWRPPKVEELQSLVDLSVPADPRLPVGHPFIGITTDTDFWSATTSYLTPAKAFVVPLTGGLSTPDKGDPYDNWCVRGASGHDGGH